MSEQTVTQSELKDLESKKENNRKEVAYQITLIGLYWKANNLEKVKEIVKKLVKVEFNFEEADEWASHVKLLYMDTFDCDEYIVDVFEHLRHCKINAIMLETLFYADFRAARFYAQRGMYLEALQLLECVGVQIEERKEKEFRRDIFLDACLKLIANIHEIMSQAS